ncbi:unnamed protein product [Brassicogethes aeneus]|uniref:C2H2-type domain-containing protein n=1 Tax=Brassicogethes aeneus TaxID=1431903 RepID=A0A9P0FBI3_BRAAE|nr:unnamed protein product [Brassicogethes aeneus]
MPFVCNSCSKVFARKIQLNKHMENLHKDNDFHKYLSKCLEDNCQTSFKYTAHLREHLQSCHSKIIENETLYFSTEGEFYDWKNTICKNNNVQYNCMKKNDLTYFNCNRSGLFKDNNKNTVKCLKSQGSCKINSNCTSQIILKKMNMDKYRVDYFKTHYGHDLEVQHIRIPREDRIDISARLSSGVPVVRILDSYRNSIEEEKLSRCDIITRKDINNIKTAFNINIQEGVRHENDSVSVELLVDQSKDFVLLHKKQGEHFEKLALNDFCIIFMNVTQTNMLQRFGSAVVAIDSTHGLNMYDFELTTLMVIDEFGEGFPVACMFTNRKDTLVFEIFFQKIKEKAGLITPNVFMSDITEVYYNAWKATMGGEIPHRLYCAWHIDRAWRTNLSKIPKIETRKQVYQTLKVLQSALTLPVFERNFDTVKKLFHNNPDTKEFAEYFLKKYSNNCHMWAFCYRKNCGINTNMVIG